MKAVLILTLIASNSVVDSEECPVSLVFNIPKLTTPEKSASNLYAQCMTIPHLPVADQLNAKRAKCASKGAGKTSERLATALGWVDKMAINFAGCETNLKVKRK